MKITKKTTISELLEEKGEEGAEALMNAGMGCVGCPMGQVESIEDGCKGHGINKKEIEDLVKKLNKK